MPVIWCVEDDPSIREIEVYVLNTTGMEAYGFENGTIFWEILQQKQPDLILLDVMLPGVDGVELLTRMKANEKFQDIPVIMGVLYGYMGDMQVMQLKDELRLAAAGTEESGLDFLHKVESSRFRITWIEADGAVIYDTHADASKMENHGSREEVQEALAYGHGSASRKSDTQMERTIYEAKRLQDGSVLRISITQQTMMVLVVGVLHPVCVVAVIAIVLSALLSKRMSKKIMEPLNRLDLEHPLDNDTYEELSPVLNRIHQQHAEIASQMRKLQRKSDELDQITANMQDGLVLLDKNCVVLSINPAARILFSADNDCIGRGFYTVDRHQDIAATVEAAFRDGRHEIKILRKGREYQLLLSRIESGRKVIGLVILAIDITEIQNAERNRREFSANVSHELKTPLQSIMGSAELLQNGLVKPEDTDRFLGHIYNEASRLMLLIQDVIRISHLDEGVEIPKEEVDLLAVAEEIAASLHILAEKKRVSIYVSGERCILLGVRGLVYEIVQNLCNNAVKYNVPGGSVDICVRQEGEHVVLTVADTGIGIPAEHQSRVFERFYRVDKSHSKQSGGTGLGLSIVKHARMCIFTPLNFLFSQWKKLVGKLFKSSEDGKMSQEELLMLLEEVEQEGGLDEDEGELLRNAVEFGDLQAKDILTHRVDLEAVSTEASNEEIANAFTETRFSRLLVYEESIDKIVGVIHQKDFYRGTGVISGSIRDIMAPSVFIYQTEKVDDLLHLLQSNKSHIAVVIDEYGGTLGIVTMEEILEELVGEIWDEHDEIEEAFRMLEENTYAADCAVSLDDFCDQFDVECDAESVSLGGWIMEQMGRIPKQGDYFTYRNLCITVTKLDDYRIESAQIKMLEPETVEEN